MFAASREPQAGGLFSPDEENCATFLAIDTLRVPRGEVLSGCRH
jgi:hypothetical protein